MHPVPAEVTACAEAERFETAQLMWGTKVLSQGWGVRRWAQSDGRRGWRGQVGIWLSKLVLHREVTAAQGGLQLRGDELRPQ